MRSSELIGLLELQEAVHELKRRLAPSLTAFRKGLAIRGGSAPVELITEGKRIVVKALHIRRVCEEYLAGFLDEVEVEYIATALALCPDFAAESEDVQDAIYSLSDLRQCKPHERNKVNEILDSLL